MKKLYRFIPVVALLLSACQDTDFTMDTLSGNGILNIKFADQAGASVITILPSLDLENENKVDFSLTPAADYRKCEILEFSVSDGATASVAVGDELDVTKTNYIDVTSANGKVRRFTLVAPKKFDKKVGVEITRGGETMTLGEWLCMGQGLKWVITPSEDTIGFWRCNNPKGFCPVIHNCTSAAVHFSAPIAAGFDASYKDVDNDNYFIFSSKGIYEYSYGKDGKATAQVAESTGGQLASIAGYSASFIKPGRGYWNIGQGGYATGGNTMGPKEGTGLNLTNIDVKDADIAVSFTNALSASGTYGSNYYPGTRDGMIMMYWPKIVGGGASFQPKYTFSYVFEYDTTDYDWTELLTDQSREWFGIE